MDELKLEKTVPLVHKSDESPKLLSLTTPCNPNIFVSPREYFFGAKVLIRKVQKRKNGLCCVD